VSVRPRPESRASRSWFKLWRIDARGSFGTKRSWVQIPPPRRRSSLTGRGRVNPGGCDRFFRFPGSVRTNAGKGSGSRLGRRSTRASGLGLDAGSDRRRIVAPGTRAVRLWVAVFSIVRCGRCGGTGSLRLPVIPSPPRGMEWYGRSQSGSIRVVDRATSGDQTCNDRACWLRRSGAHAGRARQRTCPSRSA
jgi:hypothetical protein